MALPYDFGARNKSAQQKSMIERLRGELSTTLGPGGRPTNRGQTGTISLFGGREQASGFLEKYDALKSQIGETSQQFRATLSQTGSASVGQDSNRRDVFVGGQRTIADLDKLQNQFADFNAELSTPVQTRPRLPFGLGGHQPGTRDEGQNFANSLNQQAEGLRTQISNERTEQVRARRDAATIASALRPRARDTQALNEAVGRGLRRRRSGQGNSPLRAGLLEGQNRKVL